MGPFDPAAAEASIRAQGQHYLELRDADASVTVLRSVLKDMIDETNKYLHTLLSLQTTSSAEPFATHERRVEILQAKQAAYKLQALHLEVEAAADASASSDAHADERRQAWAEERDGWREVVVEEI